jgi:hypothetical protein
MQYELCVSDAVSDAVSGAVSDAVSALKTGRDCSRKETSRN